MADEKFILKNTNKSNCADKGITGPFSSKFDYILKSTTGDPDYPKEACTPWIHYNVKVGNLKADALVQAQDVKTASVGSLNAKAAVWDAKKSFDIQHPTKQDHRLRYICLEGPTADVYLKGKLVEQSYIQLPDYWKDFVDMETLVINLTPNGHWQELFVDRIEWGDRIYVKNNAGTAINCDYVVYGERVDTSKNISEYQGLTPADYPGDNREYNINGK